MKPTSIDFRSYARMSARESVKKDQPTLTVIDAVTARIRVATDPRCIGPDHDPMPSLFDPMNSQCIY